MISLAMVASTIGKVKSFIDEGDLCKALESVTYSELTAGQNALRQESISKNPREAVNRALTHFESAYYVSKELKIPIFFDRGVTKKKYTVGFVSLCSGAICHKYLGDSNEIIKEKLLLAYNEMNCEINTFGDNHKKNDKKNLIEMCKESAGREFGDLIGDLTISDPGFEFFKFAEALTNDQSLVEELKMSGRLLLLRWKYDEEAHKESIERIIWDDRSVP